ncbi:TraR/DksA family transcriptional regulator [Rhodobacteraceae bacterium RKSG542]|uniref:TraR/DksA family transcriptional regulator n=1 Tax=Pseudovibrio flavus TaxID=2529854 RepID=UPI0012BC17EA|nr:TraR/DksA C4-type zinc finger protein [Pseudovibrio flavus]MTI17635.1 TraR/DksA family transcriptional regulator [Pseudovibrio flavus]
MDHSAIEADLKRRKKELEELSEISKDARSTVTLDQQSVGRLSRMDALQQQAMAEANERQRLLQIQRIESALTRLAEDEYGYCLDCGDDIAEERLQVDPAALYCFICASSHQ